MTPPPPRPSPRSGRPPAPRPSPRPWPPVEDFDDEEPIITGVHPATRTYTRHVAWLTAAKSAGVMLVAIVVASITAWRTVMAEAKANSDAGIASVGMSAAATQRELERFQKEVDVRINRSEAQGDRMEKKVDVLLDRLNVRNPAPAPKDAGK